MEAGPRPTGGYSGMSRPCCREVVTVSGGTVIVGAIPTWAGVVQVRCPLASL
jgi:hypothetical protein